MTNNLTDMILDDN